MECTTIDCSQGMAEVRQDPFETPLLVQDRITLQEIVTFKLGRGRYSRLSKESQNKLVEVLTRRLTEGVVTIEGESVDTGIRVLRGGSTNA